MENKPPLRSAQDAMKAARSQIISQYHTSRDKAKRKLPPINNLNIFLGGLHTIFNWAYHYLKSRFGKRYHPHKYPVNGNTGVYQLSKDHVTIKISMAGDWGSYTLDSEDVAKQIKDYDPHYTIHLGDVYFTGTPEEVRNNFTRGPACWHYGSIGTYAIPGNHEMYSNGKGFFITLLDLLRKQYPTSNDVQKSSYFCLENDHWRVIGLDTGQHSVSIPVIEYFCTPPTYLDKNAIKWLENEVKIQNPNDKRGLIILTHHQICSAFDDIFTKPAEQLSKALGDAKRDLIWLWGHEHRLAIYDLQYTDTNMLNGWGRCMGNGGMPEELKIPDHAKGKQYNLRYYDDRYNRTISNKRIGFNGYVNLELNGDKAKLLYYDLQKRPLMEEEFAVNNGQVTQTNFVNYLLTKF